MPSASLWTFQPKLLSDYSQKTDLIDDLMVAIEDRWTVFITYQSFKATEPVTYDSGGRTAGG